LFPGGFDEKVSKSVEYLVQQTTIGNETCNWDNNIWDTAVITRALLMYRRDYPDYALWICKNQVCEKSLRWLCMQVANWENLRYTLGVSDLSQILRTFITAKDIIPEYVGQISIEVLRGDDHLDVVDGLIQEIIHLAIPTELMIDGKSEQVIVWDDDAFGTSEILISLSRYLSTKESLQNHKLKSEILDLIGRGLRYIELQQRDGRWGIEEETAVALRAYLVGNQVWGKSRGPEPHIVFKALRYLCDEKTVFPDGSIAHEMEPTIYFALALIETLHRWRLQDGLCDNKPAIELYDFILWNTPTRSTIERSLRTKAETDASILRELNTNLTTRLRILRKQEGFWKRTLYTIVWVSLLLLLILLSNSISFTSISIPIGLQVTNWEVFIALTVAWVTFGVAAYRIMMSRIEIENI
jgi:hypothetical protein